VSRGRRPTHVDILKGSRQTEEEQNRTVEASVSSVVKMQTVTDSVASNRSSCTMTAGRGLPA